MDTEKVVLLNELSSIYEKSKVVKLRVAPNLVLKIDNLTFNINIKANKAKPNMENLLSELKKIQDPKAVIHIKDETSYDNAKAIYSGLITIQILVENLSDFLSLQVSQIKEFNFDNLTVEWKPDNHQEDLGLSFTKQLVQNNLEFKKLIYDDFNKTSPTTDDKVTITIGERTQKIREILSEEKLKNKIEYLFNNAKILNEEYLNALSHVLATGFVAYGDFKDSIIEESSAPYLLYKALSKFYSPRPFGKT
jgi:hypothetical protein